MLSRQQVEGSVFNALITSRLARISVLTSGVLLGYLEKTQIFGQVGRDSIRVMSRAVETPKASRFFLDIPTTPEVNYYI